VHRERTATLTEREFQSQLVDLATILGWSWVHFRPAVNRRGHWSTPVSGPLGTGWPDLILARPRDGRLLAVECKREGAKVTADQAAVHEVLRGAGVDVRTWTPTDWPDIEATLR
jgi:hypothetical protein